MTEKKQEGTEAPDEKDLLIADLRKQLAHKDHMIKALVQQRNDAENQVAHLAATIATGQ
jgi:hypothetical protein